jgi:2-phospho-L-lactate/phosphoenolpyruvate guanylyltransferase
VQATVRHFDPRTRAGDVLLDDGRALSFPAAAFDASGLRLLRLGQRVRIDTDAQGNVLRLTIVSLAFPGDR